MPDASVPPSRSPATQSPISRHHRVWTVALRGVAVGAADLVPGVSGGTMALILGIYDRLIAALAAFTTAAFRSALLRLELRAAWRAIDGAFLAALGLGMGVAIVGLASILGALLEEQPERTYAVFFGLIGVSAVLVLQRIETRRGVGFAFALPAAIVAAGLVFTLPASLPGSAPWLFTSGVAAVSALLLPGVSGAYVLVLLGQYSRILEAVASLDLGTLAPFGVGMVVGGLGFARLLASLLRTFPVATHGALAGFLVGSLPKVWPWQPDHEVGGTLMPPPSIPAAVEAAVLAAGAILIILVLERVAQRRSSAHETSA